MWLVGLITVKQRVRESFIMFPFFSFGKKSSQSLQGGGANMTLTKNAITQKYTVVQLHFKAISSCVTKKI